MMITATAVRNVGEKKGIERSWASKLSRHLTSHLSLDN